MLASLCYEVKQAVQTDYYSTDCVKVIKVRYVHWSLILRWNKLVSLTCKAEGDSCVINILLCNSHFYSVSLELLLLGNVYELTLFSSVSLLT